MVVGAAVFGLSFVKSPEPEADAPPPLSTAERLSGVFYEPARIFQNLRYHPRWLAAFLVVALSAVLYQVAFVQRVTPDAIAQAMNTQFDKLVESGWMLPEKAQDQRPDSDRDEISRRQSRRGAEHDWRLVFTAADVDRTLVAGRGDVWRAHELLAGALGGAYSTLPPFVIQYLLSIVLLYVKPLEQIEPLKDQSGLVRADLGLLFTPAEHPSAVRRRNLYRRALALSFVADGDGTARDRMEAEQRVSLGHRHLTGHDLLALGAGAGGNLSGIHQLILRRSGKINLSFVGAGRCLFLVRSAIRIGALRSGRGARLSTRARGRR